MTNNQEKKTENRYRPKDDTDWSQHTRILNNYD